MSDPDPERASPEPPSGPPPLNALAATGWALGITFLFFVFAVVLAKVRPGSELDVVSGVACQAIAYLVGLFLILRVHAPEAGIRDFLGVRPTSWLFYPLAIALGAALQLPANAIYNAVERWSGDVDKDTLTEVFKDASSPKRALIALVVILFGPMLEEVLFRGALFRPMLKAHPGPMVIVVTATLFAIAHPSFQMYLPIALVGLVLGLVRWTSGSLVPSMLLHATFNAIPFYTMARALRPGAPPDTGEPAPLAYLLASCAAVVILLAAVRLLGSRSRHAAISREFDLL
jgi:uncharacterized protein